ncbi:hypothetical protein I4U23_017346 [Adineta vaga]|nr:hypothetical protein I4U23_017346 [Adineta vaga]
MQKRRVRHAVTWQQQRHMIIQLFCLSGLYLVAWTPFLVVYVINVLSDPTFLNQVTTDYLGDMLYLVHLFLPWMSFILFPELRKWLLKSCSFRQRRNTVGISPSRNAPGATQLRAAVGVSQAVNRQSQT